MANKIKPRTMGYWSEIQQVTRIARVAAVDPNRDQEWKQEVQRAAGLLVALLGGPAPRDKAAKAGAR